MGEWRLEWGHGGLRGRTAAATRPRDTTAWKTASRPGQRAPCWSQSSWARGMIGKCTVGVGRVSVYICCNSMFASVVCTQKIAQKLGLQSSLYIALISIALNLVVSLYYFMQELMCGPSTTFSKVSYFSNNIFCVLECKRVMLTSSLELVESCTLLLSTMVDW